MTLRHIILLVHRWLGLPSAVVLVIVGGTGAAMLLPDSRLGRFAGPFHERLALGLIGEWVVVTTTGLAVLLEFSGAILWWRRKQLTVRRGRGWWRAMDDLHHVMGTLLLPLMLLLAVTGFGLDAVGPDQPELRRLTMAYHTAGPFPVVVKLLYLLATLGFVVQGLTGVVMWWKPWLRARPGRRMPQP